MISVRDSKTVRLIDVRGLGSMTGQLASDLTKPIAAQVANRNDSNRSASNAAKPDLARDFDADVKYLHAIEF